MRRFWRMTLEVRFLDANIFSISHGFTQLFSNANIYYCYISIRIFNLWCVLDGGHVDQKKNQIFFFLFRLFLSNIYKNEIQWYVWHVIVILKALVNITARNNLLTPPPPYIHVTEKRNIFFFETYIVFNAGISYTLLFCENEKRFVSILKIFFYLYVNK